MADSQQGELVQTSVDDLRATIERQRTLLERCHDAFLFMPALNGSYSPVSVKEIRTEVDAALDSFWSDLSRELGRDL